MATRKKIAKDTNPAKTAENGAPKHRAAEKPVSLWPLDLESAMEGLLKVKPDKADEKGSKHERNAESE